MRNFLLILVLLLTFGLALPVRADEPPSITTWGRATVQVVPDRAVVALGVHSVDEDFSKAVADNVANADKLLKALKAMGIAEKDIATGYVSANGFGGGFGGWISPLDDKRAHVYRTYAITLTDLKMIDKVLDTALKNGATEVQGVDLQISDAAKYRDQARQQAIRAARDKAVLLAKELDATVGKPKIILETNVNSYSSSGGINGGESTIAGPEQTEPAQVFMPGRIAVEAAVRVTFELK